MFSDNTTTVVRGFSAFPDYLGVHYYRKPTHFRKNYFITDYKHLKRQNLSNNSSEEPQNVHNTLTIIFQKLDFLLAYFVTCFNVEGLYDGELLFAEANPTNHHHLLVTAINQYSNMRQNYLNLFSKLTADQSWACDNFNVATGDNSTTY